MHPNKLCGSCSVLLTDYAFFQCYAILSYTRDVVAALAGKKKPVHMHMFSDYFYANLFTIILNVLSESDANITVISAAEAIYSVLRRCSSFFFQVFQFTSFQIIEPLA